MKSWAHGHCKILLFLQVFLPSVLPSLTEIQPSWRIWCFVFLMIFLFSSFINSLIALAICFELLSVRTTKQHPQVCSIWLNVNRECRSIRLRIHLGASVSSSIIGKTPIPLAAIRLPRPCVVWIKRCSFPSTYFSPSIILRVYFGFICPKNLGGFVHVDEFNLPFQFLNVTSQLHLAVNPPFPFMKASLHRGLWHWHNLLQFLICLMP